MSTYPLANIASPSRMVRGANDLKCEASSLRSLHRQNYTHFSLTHSSVRCEEDLDRQDRFMVQVVPLANDDEIVDAEFVNNALQ